MGNYSRGEDLARDYEDESLVGNFSRDFGLFGNDSASNASTLTDLDWDSGNPLSYRVVATVMHVVIFIGGVFGNVVLILVARRTRSLQTPTYCYLVSLAFADLIVLCSAVPEAIMFHQIGIRWVLGQAGCSLLIFGNFLGINAGSLSILAFTIERFIAITRPMLAQKVCTMGRAKKVIYCVWLVSFLYCAPWLGLTKVVRDKEQPDLETCDFRISKEQYVYFFMTDLVLFYFVPLLISAFVYTKIAWIVRSRSYKAGLTKNGRDVALEQSSSGLNRTTTIGRRHGDHGSESPKFGHSFKSMASLRGSTHNTSKSNNAQALPMLMVVVVLFAVCWLPFRGLLVYNSIATTQWLDLWYLLFAKTLIYLNSAINPFLYNFMSRRFREAVYRFLGIKPRRANKPVDL